MRKQKLVGTSVFYYYVICYSKGIDIHVIYDQVHFWLDSLKIIIFRAIPMVALIDRYISTKGTESRICPWLDQSSEMTLQVIVIK